MEKRKMVCVGVYSPKCNWCGYVRVNAYYAKKHGMQIRGDKYAAVRDGYYALFAAGFRIAANEVMVDAVRYNALPVLDDNIDDDFSSLLTPRLEAMLA